MSILAKLQPLIILLSALLGLSINCFVAIDSISTIYIEICLIILLYILFVTVDLKHLEQTFKNKTYTAVALFINFIITPIIAFLLGKIFFANSMEIRIGLLMLLVTPCTDWYLVFTGLSKGNVELNISILPINLILQMLLLPVYLFLFLGNAIQMDIQEVLKSILFILCTPFILALITNRLLKHRGKIKEWLTAESDNLQITFLSLAVILMFASEGDSLMQHPELILRLFVPLLLFFILLFLISQIFGRILKFSKRDIIALNFTTLARNSPLALAIAIATFPQYPLVSLSLITGALIELPILSVISSFLLKWNTKKGQA